MRGRDALLLHVGEAGQRQRFEPLVQQRRDARGVGRDGDEQHAGQVQRQREVAVAEAVVARGVERAEQRAGRRLAQPVELAEDDQRVVAAPARQGPSRRRASTRRPGAASGADRAARRIPAGFSTPARDTRTNRRSRAAARARAKAVLPVPDGPQMHRISAAAACAPAASVEAWRATR